MEALNVRDEMRDGTDNKEMTRWEQIRGFLLENESISNADVRALCGVSAATASRILSGLVQEGKLVRCRIGGHWGYRIGQGGREPFSPVSDSVKQKSRSKDSASR